MPAARFQRLASWPTQLPGMLAWAAVALAGVCCVWLLVQLAWALLTPLDVVDGQSPVAVTAEAQAVDASSISRWHLFGNGHANQIKRDMLEAGEATKLKLSLHGTVASDGGQDGYALIANANGLERSYRVGDSIQQGVTLQAVRADHVVLDNEGRNERLELPRQSLDAMPGVRPLDAGAASLSAGPSMPRAAAPPPPTQPVYVAPRVAGGRVDWQQVQSDLRGNPDEVVARMQLEPAFEDGKMQGIRVGGGAGNPLASAAGLHPDDVVTAVNGTPLDSFARGQQLFDQLRDAQHVQLTVRRDGQEQVIDLDLSQAQ